MLPFWWGGILATIAWEMLFCAFSSHSRLFTVAICFVVCSYPLPRLTALAKGAFILCLECLLCMLRSVTHVHTHEHGYYYLDR